MTAAAALPIVLVPLGADEDALDACLAALEAGTPAGTRVWLADDARSDPRTVAMIERWLGRTALQAAYTRRSASIGDAAHLDEALKVLQHARLDERSQLGFESSIYERALQLAGSGAVRLGTTSYTAGNLRDRLETGYRRLAQLSADPAERAQLVDRANAVRVWSLL